VGSSRYDEAVSLSDRDPKANLRAPNSRVAERPAMHAMKFAIHNACMDVLLARAEMDVRTLSAFMNNRALELIM